MARLRFPGRPGYRFDRLGVRYGAEEARNVTDPSFAVVARIHKGLLLFRELFGESDEDEEFLGFTVSEVRVATKKWDALPEVQAIRKPKSKEAGDGDFPQAQLETRLASAKTSLEKLPASERTRSRVKTVVRKSYKQMISEGLAQPSKSHAVASVNELNRILNKKDKKTTTIKTAVHEKGLSKVKNIKVRIKSDGNGSKIVKCKAISPLSKKHAQSGLTSPSSSKKLSKIEKVSKLKVPFGETKKKGARPSKVLHLPVTKQVEKSKAQHLLAKAKKGTSDSDKYHKKTFILPTQSSRSSRVIKPNKRFLEDDSLNYVSPKKGKFNESVISPKGFSSPLFVNVGDEAESSGMWTDVESPLLEQPSTSKQLLGFHEDPKTCLFEQPLIVSGKRQWKPSLKVRMKLGGEEIEDSKGIGKKSDGKKGDDESLLGSPTGPISPSFIPTSPFSEPRFGLFSQMGVLGMSVKGAGAPRLLPDRDAEVEAKKRSGNNILRRAKLQLNRAALNRSKEALARKLKAQMKKEAKLEEKRLKQYGPLSPVGSVSSVHLHGTGRTGFESPPLSPNSLSTGVSGQSMKVSPISPARFVHHSPSSTSKKKAPAKVCAVCGNPSLMARKGTYFGVPSCESCSKFYRSYMLKLEKTNQSCSNNGMCEINYRNTMCEVCRFKKCVSVFPELPYARKRDGSVTSLSHAKLSKLLKKGAKNSLQAKIKAVRDKERLKRDQSKGLKNIEEKEKKIEGRRRKSGSDKSQSDSSPTKSHTPVKQGGSSPSKITESPPDANPSENTTPPTKDGRGPRIKHVCRNAAVVLGKPVARFPKSSHPRLSALPKQEKVKILKDDQEEKSAQVSDDDLPIEDIISKAQERKDDGQAVKKSPGKAVIKKQRVMQPPPSGGRRRKIRCRECKGCQADECGSCVYCFDKPKFGGRNQLKQACSKRKCSNPRYAKLGTKVLLKPKTKGGNTTGGVDSPDSSMPATSGSITKSTATSTVTIQARFQSGGSQTVALITPQKLQNVVNKPSVVNKTSFVNEVPVKRWHEEAYIPPGDDQKGKKQGAAKSGKEKAVTGSRMLTVLPVMTSQSTNARALPQWSFTNSKDHRIKAEFREAYDVDTAWSHGLALTMSGAVCVQTVCYLCGSAGKHQMLYCNVCCEPFHSFCLEDDEQPSDENKENWCCRSCQYCHVCGRQDKLLRCDKCENTYHAECLGPNYPTKPSKKKNIWVCTKCVKCKSCGATTPGVGTNATWTNDFSLCYECGKLMDKGNYCPICNKCYSDDDWEAKMVQCSHCDSWVHAKCEGLSDERYELLSCLPDDVVYTCAQCSTERPPLWELALKEEMARSLSLVLATLWNSKCAQHLLKKPLQIKAPVKSSPEVQVVSSMDTDLSHVRDEMFQQYVQPAEKCIQSSKEGMELATYKSEEDLTTRTDAVCTPTDNTGGTKEVAVCPNPMDEAIVSAQTSLVTPLTMDTNSATAISKDTTNKVTIQPDSEVPVSMETISCSPVSLVPVESSVSKDSSNATYDTTVPTCDSSDGTFLKPDTQTCNFISEDNINVNSMQNVNAHRPSDIKDKPEQTLISNSGDVQNTLVLNCDDGQGPVGDDLKTSSMSRTCNMNLQNAQTQLNSVGESNILPNDCDLTETDDGSNLHESSLVNTNTVPMETDSADVTQAILKNDFGCKNELDSSGSKSCETKCVKANEEVKPLGCTLSLQQLQGVLVPHKLYPPDFEAIKQKLYMEAYDSVESFNEDMVMIIQSALLDLDSQKSTTRKKANNSVKSIYLKQMEKFFPWFSVYRCNLWEHNKNLPKDMLSNAVLPPSIDHHYAQWLQRPPTIRSPQPSPFKRRTKTAEQKVVPMVGLDDEDSLTQTLPDGEDNRQCLLCSQYADGEPQGAGRLLYAGQDDWIHVNCALWSAEVFEEVDGSLQNVHDAWFRGKQLRCDVCNLRGATVGCCTRGCSANFHFICARKSNCVFQDDKKVFCWTHRGNVDGEVIKENKFDVLRRVCIDMDDIRLPKKSWSKGLDPRLVNVIFGACTVESLGELTYLSDNLNCLLPVSFKCTRMYWSTSDPHKRCLYTCRIIEVQPANPLLSPEIVFKELRIVHDEKHPDYIPMDKLDPCVQSYLKASNNNNNCNPSIVSPVNMDISTEPTITDSSGALTLMDVCDQPVKLPCLSSSFSGISSIVQSEDSVFSSSWPQSSKPKQDNFDYSLLSPTTLRHLNIDLSKVQNQKPVEKTTQPVSRTIDSDLVDLTKVVCKLNNAAAVNTDRHRRESSVESNKKNSLTPVTRLSPITTVSGNTEVSNQEPPISERNQEPPMSERNQEPPMCERNQEPPMSERNQEPPISERDNNSGSMIKQVLPDQMDHIQDSCKTPEVEDVMYFELPEDLQLGGENGEEIQLMLVDGSEGIEPGEMVPSTVDPVSDNTEPSLQLDTYGDYVIKTTSSDSIEIDKVNTPSTEGDVVKTISTDTIEIDKVNTTSTNTIENDNVNTTSTDTIENDVVKTTSTDTIENDKVNTTLTDTFEKAVVEKPQSDTIENAIIERVTQHTESDCQLISREKTGRCESQKTGNMENSEQSLNSTDDSSKITLSQQIDSLVKRALGKSATDKSAVKDKLKGVSLIQPEGNEETLVSEVKSQGIDAPVLPAGQMISFHSCDPIECASSKQSEKHYDSTPQYSQLPQALCENDTHVNDAMCLNKRYEPEDTRSSVLTKGVLGQQETINTISPSLYKDDCGDLADINGPDVTRGVLGSTDINDPDVKTGVLGSTDISDPDVTTGVAGDLASTDINDPDVKTGVLGPTDINDPDVKTGVLGPTDINDPDVKTGVLGPTDINGTDVTTGVSGDLASTDINDPDVKTGVLGPTDINDPDVKTGVLGSTDINDPDVKTGVLGSTNINDPDVKTGVLGSTDINDPDVKTGVLGSTYINDLDVKTGVLGSTDINDPVVTTGVSGDELNTTDITDNSEKEIQEECINPSTHNCDKNKTVDSESSEQLLHNMCNDVESLRKDSSRKPKHGQNLFDVLSSFSTKPEPKLDADCIDPTDSSKSLRRNIFDVLGSKESPEKQDVRKSKRLGSLSSENNLKINTKSDVTNPSMIIKRRHTIEKCQKSNINDQTKSTSPLLKTPPKIKMSELNNDTAVEKVSEKMSNVTADVAFDPRSCGNNDQKDDRSCDSVGLSTDSQHSGHLRKMDCEGESSLVKGSEERNCGKSRAAKKSEPLKTYPLRRTVRRLCDAAMARAEIASKQTEEESLRECSVILNKDIAESEEGSSTCSEPPVLKTLGLRKVKDDEVRSKHKRSESHPPSLPLHHMIALKIKAQSLAKSAPGKEGPFKCPLCKRLYRTKESFNTHVEKCDFEVSSDEDEDEEAKGESRKLKHHSPTPSTMPSVKRGRGRPPKRKCSVDGTTPDGSSPVLKRANYDRNALSRTPTRGRGRHAKVSRGRRGLLRSLSLPTEVNFYAKSPRSISQNCQSPDITVIRKRGRPPKKCSPSSPLSSDKVQKLKTPKDKIRSPPSSQKVGKRKTPVSSSKDNPILRKLRSRTTLTTRVKTPFKGRRREVEDSDEALSTHSDEIKLCEITGNILINNQIVNPPDYNDYSQMDDHSNTKKDNENGCETQSSYGKHNQVESPLNIVSCEGSKKPPSVETNLLSPGEIRLGKIQKGSHSIIRAQTKLSFEEVSPEESHIVSKNITNQPDKISDDRREKEKSSNPCEVLKKKVVPVEDIIDLTLSGDTDSEDKPAEKTVKPIYWPRETKKKPSTNSRKSEKPFAPDATEIIVYPKSDFMSSVLPKYAKPMIELNTGKGGKPDSTTHLNLHKTTCAKLTGDKDKSTGIGSSDAKDKTTGTGSSDAKDKTTGTGSSDAKDKTTGVQLTGNKDKTTLGPFSDTKKDMNKAIGVQLSGQKDSTAATQLTDGTLKTYSVKMTAGISKDAAKTNLLLSQSLSGRQNNVSSVNLKENISLIGSESKNLNVAKCSTKTYIHRTSESKLQTSTLESPILQKRGPNILKNIKKVPVMHPPPGIQQLIDSCTTMAAVKPGMNINYLGSFIMNSKDGVSVNQPAGTQTLQQSSPQFNVAVNNQYSLQAALGGTVLSPVNPQSFVQQVLTNQFQTVNQGFVQNNQGYRALNQVVQGVPISSPQHIPYTNPSILSPTQPPSILPPSQSATSHSIPSTVMTNIAMQAVPNAVLQSNVPIFSHPNIVLPTNLPPFELRSHCGPSLSSYNVTMNNSTNATPTPHLTGNLSSILKPTQLRSKVQDLTNVLQTPCPNGYVTIPSDILTNTVTSSVSLTRPLPDRANLSSHSTHLGTRAVPILAPPSTAMATNGQVNTVSPHIIKDGGSLPLVANVHPQTNEKTDLNYISKAKSGAEVSKQNLSNIVRVVVPSSKNPAPFINALSQESALKILKELTDKKSVSETGSQNSIITVNCQNHPRLRNMLSDLDTSLKADPSSSVTVSNDIKVPGNIPSQTISDSQSHPLIKQRKFILSKQNIRRLLQEPPCAVATMSSEPKRQLQPEKSEHLSESVKAALINNILKPKVLSKPTIDGKRQSHSSNWVRQIPPLKKVSFDTILEKNGMRRGYVGNSVTRNLCERKQISSQSEKGYKHPNNVRKSRAAPSSGRVTKVHPKTRTIQRPSFTGHRLQSHPIIHSQRDLSVLPEPATEEEVTESPLVTPLYCYGGLQEGNKRKIPKDKPHLMFEITSDDGFSTTAHSMEEAWRQVIDKVQDARTSARLKQLSFSSVNGSCMFGVNHPAVVYLIEQLFSARTCHRYKFNYFTHSRPQPEDEPAENVSGCIRCEPFLSRKPYDMFSFLMSHYRNKPHPEQQGPGDEEMVLKSSRRATSMDLPMAMRFRHLQEHSREAVGVYRSVIHGRGLFCKRNIDAGEMVIEYAGEVIRSILTDKREKYYESKGIGCYMFRIDDTEVVDATVHGSAARFINHSCDPNCYSKVINVDGKKHIVIFAMRPIKKGEELTYDYKFPIEEVKIPCTCGSKRCRKYLN